MDETPIDTPASPWAVTRTITLDAPAALVWDELTDRDALADWLGLVVDSSVAAGATGTHREDGIERDVRFLDVDREHGLAWHWGDDADGATVTVTLVEDGDTTSVTVTETRGAAATCSVADAHVDLGADAPFGAWDRRLLGLELRLAGTPAFAAV